jgi:3-hydroxyisobutyrate dehydrogenase-like beta-hydroxyacid dehydrogenase
MKIAFLGTGLMGEPMALRLLAAGMPMIAYNRTPEKLATLQKAGAEIADAPAAAIRASDYVVLMLSDAPAIAETLFSDITKSELKGKTVISMSTISPSQSRALCDAAVAAGGEYLEAPVLGSTPEAKAGTLTVMVGATEAQYQRCLPILRYFGQEPRLLGEVGAASATKLALN